MVAPFSISYVFALLCQLAAARHSKAVATRNRLVNQLYKTNSLLRNIFDCAFIFLLPTSLIRSNLGIV